MTEHNDNIIKFPREDLSVVEADAARWLARITSGSLTLGELAEFEFWRIASRDRDRVYRELEAMWDGLGGRSAPRNQGPTNGARTSLFRHRSLWAMRLGQIAAALIAAITISQYYSTWRYDYRTAPGESRQIALSDGSKVYMSGATAINIRFSRTGDRTVELARGEAFFEVKHDASRPFTVEVGTGKIRDIGTAFSVSHKGKSSAVAVEEGIVAVSAGGQYDLLYKGQQVSFDRYLMRAKSEVDTSTISPWRRGLYIADDKALGEVLDDLGAYYPRKILIVDDALAKRRVNVVVQLNHIEDWLEALNDTTGVSVHRYGPITIVGAR